MFIPPNFHPTHVELQVWRPQAATPATPQTNPCEERSDEDQLEQKRQQVLTTFLRDDFCALWSHVILSGKKSTNKKW
jgi:hypothetical protein